MQPFQGRKETSCSPQGGALLTLGLPYAALSGQETPKAPAWRGHSSMQPFQGRKLQSPRMARSQQYAALSGQERNVLFSPGWRAADPGLTLCSPFRAGNSKSPRMARSQQYAALSGQETPKAPAWRGHSSMQPFQGRKETSCSPQGGALLTLGYPMQPFQGRKLQKPPHGEVTADGYYPLSVL